MTDKPAKPESVELDEFKKSFDKRKKKYPSLDELGPTKKLKQGTLDSRRDQSKKQDKLISYKDAKMLKDAMKELKKKGKQIKLDKSLEKQGYMPTEETQAKTSVPAFDKANRLRSGLKKGGSAKGCKLAMKGKGRAYGKNS